MAGRDPVRAADLAEFRQHPDFPTIEPEDKPLTPEQNLYPPMYHYNGYKWGMAIDLNVCTGCSACIIACQAENNIAVVGKDQVARGRHMHWIRVDRYYSGNLDEPAMYNQPVPCMHCEQAPCEVVCPVAATVHSNEGLNEMVYNRCVGTRFCSNNCPYKVRRFNWFDYNAYLTDTEKMVKNPDVTVRERGVMEKCTFCVQRIKAAEIQAQAEKRELKDGEVKPACVQSCPPTAMVFGDLNDPNSEVSRLARSNRGAKLLAELGTLPKVTYLQRDSWHGAENA